MRLVVIYNLFLLSFASAVAAYTAVLYQDFWASIL